MSGEQVLHCPVDGEVMVRQQHGEGFFHACRRCRGLWIPRTYLLALKRRAERQWKRKQTEILEPSMHDNPLPCPQCASSLLARRQESVPIDVCSQCRAVWLDGDELLHLAKAGIAASARETGRKRRAETSRVEVFTTQGTLSDASLQWVADAACDLVAAVFD